MASEKRLIDAMDTVTKISKKVIPQIEQGCHPQRVYAEVLSCIADAPTVDAVEVVHGRWEEDRDMCTITCSECGELWCIMDNCTETFNYCPNCGAKMDGDSNG